MSYETCPHCGDHMHGEMSHHCGISRPPANRIVCDSDEYSKTEKCIVWVVIAVIIGLIAYGAITS